jgi:hypothetical protein
MAHTHRNRIPAAAACTAAPQVRDEVEQSRFAVQPFQLVQGMGTSKVRSPAHVWEPSWPVARPSPAARPPHWLGL